MTNWTPNSRSTSRSQGRSASVLAGADILSPDDFSRMATLLYDKSGIRLTPGKKTLLEGRIRKRQVALGLPSPHAYCEFLFSRQGLHAELEDFINALTTNKTDFMREFGHFQFLMDVALPRLLRERRQLRFWSAACSKGAEPYTLAMVLEEYLRQFPQCGMDYQILATDIDTHILQEAVQAIYSESEIKPVPQDWRSRYLLKGKSGRREQVRIVPALRKKVRFQHLNLMDAFDFDTLQDVIFCRNVTIYFDRDTQNRLIRKFLSVLRPDGYLIMGHSESLDIQANPLRAIAPSIYQKA